MTVNAARKNRSEAAMKENAEKIIFTFAAVGIYKYNEVRKEWRCCKCSAVKVISVFLN